MYQDNYWGKYVFPKINIIERLGFRLTGIIKIFLISGTHCLHFKENRQGEIFQRRQMNLKIENFKKWLQLYRSMGRYFYGQKYPFTM